MKRKSIHLDAPTSSHSSDDAQDYFSCLSSPLREISIEPEPELFPQRSGTVKLNKSGASEEPAVYQTQRENQDTSHYPQRHWKSTKQQTHPKSQDRSPETWHFQEPVIQPRSKGISQSPERSRELAVPQAQLKHHDISSLVLLLRSKISSWLNDRPISDDEDLFQQGLEPAQCISLTKELREEFGFPQLALNRFFKYPTVSEYAKALASDLSDQQNMPNVTMNVRCRVMEKVFQSHMDIISKFEPTKILTDRRSDKMDILLTGATGHIASFVLARLLSNPDVQHITCLSRAAEMKDRLQQRIKQSCRINISSYKHISYLQGDLANYNFGLSTVTYQQLRVRTTHVIHAAWAVDFLMPLQFFNRSLDSIDNLLDFARGNNSYPMEIVFISSMSSAGNLPGRVMREEISPSYDSPIGNGYGESKYLAERLLSTVAPRFGIKAKIIRLGQIAAPLHAHGAWNAQEWFPRLINSSFILRTLPESIPALAVDWVPVDILGIVIEELLLHNQQQPVQVYQPYNSTPIGWESVCSAVANTLSSASGSEEVKTVPYAQWLELVRAAVRQEQRQQLPAAPLLDWFEGIAKEKVTKRWDNTNAVQASRTLRDLGPVTGVMLSKWVGDMVAAASSNVLSPRKAARRD